MVRICHFLKKGGNMKSVYDNTLFFDLETIPTRLGWAIDEITAGIKPPATFKKPESIAGWLKENGEQAANDAIHATGLDGGLGEICCFGWVYGDDEIKNFTGTELEILENVQSLIYQKQPHVVVGHNILNFDLNFLYKRFLVNGLSLPDLPFNAKPWGDEVFDTMLKWDTKKFISLDRLAKIFGMSGKQGMSGKDVAKYYANGRISEIAEYCMNDVELTRAIYRRMKNL